jgi:undecaprenyl-diphosphatase
LVTASALGGVDRAVWRFFVHHEFLVSFAKLYTQWGVMSILSPLALLVGIALFMKYRLVAVAIIPMVSLQVNDVLTASAKAFFGVVRPPQSEWLAGAGGGSFPSGHTANTTALVIALALVLASRVPSNEARRWVFGGAALLVSLMGWSRLALNVHWLSDVLAGWVLGSSTAFACVLIVMKLARIAPVRQIDGT